MKAGWWPRWLGSATVPPVDDTRWIVLDVETSGLDMRRDRLLAIAALVVRPAGRHADLAPAESFEIVLQQDHSDASPDRDNILLHGIGVGAQREGVLRADALQRFQAFVGHSPLVAFHAPFDRTMIERAFRAEGLPAPPNPWLDLEPLAAVLMPEVKAHALDDWLAALGIHCAARHEAAADTLATAELLQQLWPRLVRELHVPGFVAAQRLAAQRRWLQR